MSKIEYTEITCTRDNVREELSDLFPDPTREQMAAIDWAVSAAGVGAQGPRTIEVSRLGVFITIVPEAPNTEQIPVTPEEDAAWRAKEAQERAESLESHAGNRHLGKSRSVTHPQYARGGVLSRPDVAIDNANTGEVGTFTDGPEERYSAQPIGFYGTFGVEDRQDPTNWIARCGNQEHAELIVDALNAWEASQ